MYIYVFLFLSLSTYVYVCVCLSVILIDVYMCRDPRWTEEGVRPFGSGIIGGYESPDKGARNQPAVLYKRSKHS